MSLIRLLFSHGDSRIMTDQTPIVTAIRHDGWTPARRTQFLDHLAHDGSVRAACARVGMSREAAYRLRRRDALFARGWDTALVLAHAASAEVLANRALDGVEEDIWYRGELVGTRRKYDSRLLLAHMARLDKLAEAPGAEHDAARFDEILALVGGEPVPPGFECVDDGMPPDREFHVAMAVEDAEIAFAESWHAEPEGDLDPDAEDFDLDAEIDPEAARERLDRSIERERDYEEALIEKRWDAGIAAGAQWDAWRHQAHAAADRLLAMPLAAATLCTVSELSTSSGEAPAEAALEAGTGSAPAPTWADYYAGRGPRPQA
jgi:hypothetical protein